MRLCLVRHGVAVERGTHVDAERPLTDEGRARMELAAAGLTRLIAVDAIFTSPYLRALQTAEVLGDAYRISRLARTHALVTGDNEGLFALIGGAGETVLVVGHEPHISGTLSYALTGDGTTVRAQFKKGGAALVRFEGMPRAGEGTLEWLVPPSTLRALATS